jgi:hypothetical protein
MPLPVDTSNGFSAIVSALAPRDRRDLASVGCRDSIFGSVDLAEAGRESPVGWSAATGAATVRTIGSTDVLGSAGAVTR